MGAEITRANTVLLQLFCSYSLWKMLFSILSAWYFYISTF